MRVMKTVVVVVMCWAAVGSWADGARRRGAASVPGPTATANGIVASVGASALVVHRSNGDDVTVQVTATTLIKEHGTAIHLSDIEAGDRVEARAGEALRLCHDHLGDRARVVHRAGVRHRAHVGESARRRRREAAPDVLLVLLSRFADVCMQVDEPREEPRPRSLDDARPELGHPGARGRRQGRRRRCHRQGAVRLVRRADRLHLGDAAVGARSRRAASTYG